MERISDAIDSVRGTVTYKLPDGRWITFDSRAVREYGVAELMRAEGLERFLPTERVPVYQYGRRIGTMPPDFDPASARSTSFLYDVRPDDFMRDGDRWIVGRTMGASDVDCVAGFIRDAT